MKPTTPAAINDHRTRIMIDFWRDRIDHLIEHEVDVHLKILGRRSQSQTRCARKLLTLASSSI